jgi:hypothetical protein
MLCVCWAVYGLLCVVSCRVVLCLLEACWPTLLLLSSGVGLGAR